MGGLEFLSAYPFWTVVLIVTAAFICIFKFISWCKELYAKREKLKTQMRHEGEVHQKEIDDEAVKDIKTQNRIAALETSVTTLTTLLQTQQQQINLLIKSDELDIKAWIQMQHEKWMALQCIDSQSLDLLIQRYEVYSEEGGNGWAKKMVDEIKTLPVITVVPVAPKGVNR